jgi:hypothetical protein
LDAAYFAALKRGFTPRRREGISASARGKLGMGLVWAQSGRWLANFFRSRSERLLRARSGRLIYVGARQDCAESRPSLRVQKQSGNFAKAAIRQEMVKTDQRMTGLRDKPDVCCLTTNLGFRSTPVYGAAAKYSAQPPARIQSREPASSHAIGIVSGPTLLSGRQ